nr:MAG TPA: hypothetical protein [Bacteriophage sp.]
MRRILIRFLDFFIEYGTNRKKEIRDLSILHPKDTSRKSY